MKKLREQLLRWTLLVRKIQAQPGIAFKALQRELERELTFRGYEPVCSDATLKRDLAELREEFGIDITYSRTQGATPCTTPAVSGPTWNASSNRWNCSRHWARTADCPTTSGRRRIL